jgi:hypothetical protein
MRVAYKNSIEYRALQFIEHTLGKVLLRKDFVALGSYRQVNRVLYKLVLQKKLVKIGFGVYAKAYQTEFIPEALIEDGFDTVAREVLNRLKIAWEPGSAEQAYNSGKSQQVPIQNIVRLKSRFRRKIAYANRRLYFEGNINAK